MKLGISPKVFARPMLEESLDGVQASGLEAVQLESYMVLFERTHNAVTDCWTYRLDTTR